MKTKLCTKCKKEKIDNVYSGLGWKCETKIYKKIISSIKNI